MTKRMLLAATVAALLSACGGGGGSGDATPPAPTTFNMEAAIASSLSTGVSFSGLQTTVNGNVLEFAFSYAPTTDGLFFGDSYKRSIFSSSIKLNGVVSGTGASTNYFSLNPVRVIGTTTSDGFTTKNAYDGTMPTNATVGQSGPYYHTNVSFTGDTAVVAQGTTTWSLEADTASTAWACLMTVDSTSPDWEKDCYRIDAAGQISGAKIVLFVQGQTVTFQ